MPSNRIDAAFRSSRNGYCYMFVKQNCVILEYNSRGEKKIAEGPTHISQWIPRLGNTPFAKVIDCAFDADGNEAFIFSGNLCAKIDYAPYTSKPKLLLSSVPINEMFPYLSETIFEKGIDAAFRYKDKQVFIFKGDKYALIDYESEKLLVHQSISHGFGSLFGTVFEHGIDVAFSDWGVDAAFIFKGQYFAYISYDHHIDDSDKIVNSRIKPIKKVWPFLEDILQDEI